LAKNRTPHLEILRATPTNNLNGVECRWVLYIDGRHVEGSQRHIAVLACLYDELGHVVPYKRLCPVLGQKTTGPTSLHLLRQYTTWIRQTLAVNKSPYVLTVAADVGYALCEISATRRRR
jgi:hypothetical protein